MTPMTPIRRLTSALLVLFGLVLAGCDQGPDDAATRAVLDQRLAAALKPPVTEVASFRRIGSGPLPATADGKARRIVYFNTELKLNQDVDFASWNGLNASAFATLLGATEKGVLGIKPGGNKASDLLRVHGSATFVDEGGSWVAVPWVAPEVGEGSPEDNTGPPSEAKRLLDAVQALLADGGGDRALRSTIVAEELASPTAGCSSASTGSTRRSCSPAARRAASTPTSPRSSRGGSAGAHWRRAPATGGSIENARLVTQKLADVGLVQNDVAALAAKVRGRSRRMAP